MGGSSTKLVGHLIPHQCQSALSILPLCVGRGHGFPLHCRPGHNTTPEVKWKIGSCFLYSFSSSKNHGSEIANNRYTVTLLETNMSPEKKKHPERKESYSNHPFSGAKLLLVSGRDIPIVSSVWTISMISLEKEWSQSLAFYFGIGISSHWFFTVISSEASFPKMNDPKNKLHGQVIQWHLFISQLEVTVATFKRVTWLTIPKRSQRLARGTFSWQKIPGPLGELILEKNGRMTSYCWTYESIKQIKQNWEGKFILHPRNLTYIPTIAIFNPGNTFSNSPSFFWGSRC